MYTCNYLIDRKTQRKNNIKIRILRKIFFPVGFWGMWMPGPGRGRGPLIWCTTDTLPYPINSYSKWYFEMSISATALLVANISSSQFNSCFFCLSHESRSLNSTLALLLFSFFYCYWEVNLFQIKTENIKHKTLNSCFIPRWNERTHATI